MSRQLAAASRQLPAASYQLPAASSRRQLPVTSHQPASINDW